MSISKKPGQIGQIEATPKTEQNQVVFATLAHHGEQAPEGKSRKAKPEHDPMEGEEAEEAKRGRGNKTANLWGIDRVEIKILDFGSD
jgi:hypothetical protein